jgi:DNA-binding NtrC family response regulator
MPASIVVVHDDPSFLDDTVRALRRVGYDAAGFLQSMAALDALEAAERVEVLVTRVTFPDGTPHGIALARMARRKRPCIKVLFIIRPEWISHTEGLGAALLIPVTADDVVAKVGAILGETNSDAGETPAGG